LLDLLGQQTAGQSVKPMAPAFQARTTGISRCRNRLDCSINRIVPSAVSGDFSNKGAFGSHSSQQASGRGRQGLWVPAQSRRRGVSTHGQADRRRGRPCRRYCQFAVFFPARGIKIAVSRQIAQGDDMDVAIRSWPSHRPNPIRFSLSPRWRQGSIHILHDLAACGQPERNQRGQSVCVIPARHAALAARARRGLAHWTFRCRQVEECRGIGAATGGTGSGLR